MSEKALVRDYFNTLGFDRWRRIYGEDEVNRVQKDIRKGHARTIDTVLAWLGDDLSGQTVCDAGCGVGSLSIPMAKRGAIVKASDISEKMVGEARSRQQVELGQTENPQFSTSDLEAISGSYDTVVCLDVMIHYPEAAALDMIEHLTSLGKERVIFSFAPKTPLLTVLKKIGEFFPGPSKTTRAYQHRETAILERLQSLGWAVHRRETIKSQFYFSWVLETKPV